MRNVETCGGVIEQVPVYDDPAYTRALRQWRINVWRDSLSVIAGGLNFDIPEHANLEALKQIGMGNATRADYLRFNVVSSDQEALVEAVYYLSTVTAQGIREAEARFGYTWRDKPLSAWTVGYSYGKRGALAVDYRAAMRSRLPWPEFCALTGPEQSEIVAFWNLEDRLNWLMENAR
jgi:hypothetical protein